MLFLKPFTSNRLFHYLILFTGILMISCSLSSEADTESELDVELLKKHWVHSHEENIDKNGLIHPVNGIYRPSDYKEFPANWFRMQYKFYDEGDAEFYFLAPNDGHYFKPAKWEVDIENRLLTIIDSLDTEPNNTAYLIKELTEDKLVLESITE